MIRSNGIYAYIIKRVTEGLVTSLIVISITFLLLRVIPGGPFDSEKPLAPATKKIIEESYGLNLPLAQQYLNYMKSIFNGDLGYSYKYDGRPVSDILTNAYPQTFYLGIWSILVSLFGGIFLGLIFILKPESMGRKILDNLLILGSVVPSFLIAPVLIYFFSFGKPWDIVWPSFYRFLYDNNLLLPSALAEDYKHFILPVITLSIHPLTTIARLTQQNAADVAQYDFIRTARAKGLSDFYILSKHILKNALLPVLSYVGPMIAGILMGSFVVEIVFSINGIAKFFVDSVFSRDYPVVLALTWCFSLLLVFGNILTDLICRWIDPRWDKK